MSLSKAFPPHESFTRHGGRAHISDPVGGLVVYDPMQPNAMSEEERAGEEPSNRANE